jgi:hypothetical protein
MGVPVGDVLRSFVNPKSWLGRILAMLKGVTVKVGGVDVNLNQGPGIGQTGPGMTKFDSKPGGPFSR